MIALQNRTYLLGILLKWRKLIIVDFIFQNLPKLLPKTFPNLRGINISWYQQYTPYMNELEVLFKSFKNCLKLHYISLNIRTAIDVSILPVDQYSVYFFPIIARKKIRFENFDFCISIIINPANWVFFVLQKLEVRFKDMVHKRLVRRSLKALSITNGEYRHYYSKDFFDEGFRPSKQCHNRSIFYAGSSDECVNYKNYWLNKRCD